MKSNFSPIGFEAIDIKEDNGLPTIDVKSGLKSLTDSLNHVADGHHEDESGLYLEQRGPNGQKLRVDYVLVWKLDKESEKKKLHAEKREIFEALLRDEGLILELVLPENSNDGKTGFVKIHGSWEVLSFYAEFTNLKMPIKSKDFNNSRSVPVTEERGCLSGAWNWFWTRMSKLCAAEITQEDDYFTAPFRKDKLHMFLLQENQESFFSPAQRSLLVDEAMRRAVQNSRAKMNGHVDKCSISSIEKLISEGVYDSGFPLHEGEYTTDDVHSSKNARQELYNVWARWCNWYKCQPLDHIRNYYGERIAIYFCWLGMYTFWLIPVAIIGFLVFLYGFGTVNNNSPSNEICYNKTIGKLVMCPLCDRACSYWHLKTSCLMNRITYIFDNYATLVFAIIMSLWATLFLEFWTRKQFEIQYEWDVQNFEEEETVRPEYEIACGHKYISINPVTGHQEPHMPLTMRAPRYCVSFLTVVFMVSLVVIALVAVIIYRVVMVTVIYAFGVEVANPSIKSMARLVTTMSAALIQLVVIFILNQLYRVLAIRLTNLEEPRTETDYEDSFTFKIYCFQFANYYASLFYVAYFKGSFVGRPGKYDLSFAGKRQEECDPAGCLIELCIQMIIIFGGKQFASNFVELGLPWIKTVLRRRWNSAVSKKKSMATSDAVEAQDQCSTCNLTQFEKDFGLEPVARLNLFDEYLEMVVQFGFVTMFVAAFPLAPLFALFNNIMEIRLDATKLVTLSRRPLARKAQDIGIWSNILKAISVISVLSNALIIGYTSDSIPKLVYKFAYSKSNSLEGYVLWKLSTFTVSDFSPESIPDHAYHDKSISNSTKDIKTCLYRDFRLGRDAPEPYQYSHVFWQVLCARFIFVLLFEHIVFFLTSLIAWLVPDVPPKVKLAAMQERFQVNLALLQDKGRAETLSSNAMG